jgi:hypothetical protein
VWVDTPAKTLQGNRWLSSTTRHDQGRGERTHVDDLVQHALVELPVPRGVDRRLLEEVLVRPHARPVYE